MIGLLTQRVYLRNPYRNELERYIRLAKRHRNDRKRRALHARGWWLSVSRSYRPQSRFLPKELGRCHHEIAEDCREERRSALGLLVAGSTSLSPSDRLSSVTRDPQSREKLGTRIDPLSTKPKFLVVIAAAGGSQHCRRNARGSGIRKRVPMRFV